MHVAPLQDVFRKHLAAAGVTDVRVLDQEPVFGVLQLVSDQGR
jgi:glucosamine kinase